MVALKRLGFTIDRYVAYEIDKNAISVSKRNFPQIEHMGDVRNADFSQYVGFDLILGGFPCQDLSISNTNRQGLQGERSCLFWELVRAINEVHPKYFLVENNYNIPKIDLSIITRELGVSPILLNSSLVSAQSRKRLYWTNIPNINLPEDRKIYLKDIITEFSTTINYRDRAKFSDVEEVQTDKPLQIGILNKGRQGERIYSIQGKSVTLIANGGGLGAKTGLYLIDNMVRKLSPVEAERLQTLPDGYTEGLSNTGRLKLIGNGWTVDIIAHILQYIETGDEFDDE